MNLQLVILCAVTKQCTINLKICQLIVHWLVTVQTNKRYTVQRIKIIEFQQANICNRYTNTKLILLKTQPFGLTKYVKSRN